MILVVTREIDMSCNITAVRCVSECYTRRYHIRKTVNERKKPESVISISLQFFDNDDAIEYGKLNMSGKCT